MKVILYKGESLFRNRFDLKRVIVTFVKYLPTYPSPRRIFYLERESRLFVYCLWRKDWKTIEWTMERKGGKKIYTLDLGSRDFLPSSIPKPKTTRLPAPKKERKISPTEAILNRTLE